MSAHPAMVGVKGGKITQAGSATTSLRNTYLAVAAMLAAIVCLDLMAVGVRHLLPRFGAPELSVYRNLIGIIPSLILLFGLGEVRFRRSDLTFPQWRLALLRGGCVALAQMFFYASLQWLAFATVSTIIYSLALFSVLFAIPLLGERVGPVRMGAVLIGFGGVVMIINPASDSFTLYALMPLAAAALYALSSITVRLIDRSVPNALIYIYSSSAAIVGALGLALATSGFSPITHWADLALILAMGLSGGTGVLLLMVAYRLAEASILAPFNYFGLASAFLLGWIFFDELPYAELFPGILLIAGSGLVVIWREHHQARKLPTEKN